MALLRRSAAGGEYCGPDSIFDSKDSSRKFSHNSLTGCNFSDLTDGAGNAVDALGEVAVKHPNLDAVHGHGVQFITDGILYERGRGDGW